MSDRREPSARPAPGTERQRTDSVADAPSTHASSAAANEVKFAQLAGAVLWPSFVAAGLATTVVFAILDPLELEGASGPLSHSRLGGYSAGFLGFWFLCALSSSVSVYFAQRPEVPLPPQRTDA